MYPTSRPDPIVAPCSMRKAAAAGLKGFLVVPTARYNLLQVHACPPRQYNKYDVNRTVNVSGAPPCPGIRKFFDTIRGPNRNQISLRAANLDSVVALSRPRLALASLFGGVVFALALGLWSRPLFLMTATAAAR
jgi:hypothetical protein